jgi:hypothetical protein
MLAPRFVPHRDDFDVRFQGKLAGAQLRLGLVRETVSNPQRVSGQGKHSRSFHHKAAQKTKNRRERCD